MPTATGGTPRPGCAIKTADLNERQKFAVGENPDALARPYSLYSSKVLEGARRRNGGMMEIFHLEVNSARLRHIANICETLFHMEKNLLIR